jgi:hypothetical protein
MAKTIAQLPDATVVNGGDELIIQQSGVTKRATKTEVLAGITDANIDAAAAIVGTKIDPDFGAQNVETTGAVLGGPGTVFSGSSGGNIVRITQTGAGNALIVEDSTNPDSTPFVVDATGTAVCGHTTATSNASNLFEAAGVGRRAIAVYSYSSNLALGAPRVVLARSPSGTLGSATLLASNLIGTVDFQANDGTNFIQAASISAAVDGTTGTADMPGMLLFSTTADGDSEATERMRIDSAGNVGIGAAPNAAAVLNVASTSKGFLPPRMTTAQRDAISTPPTGLMIYNTSTNVLNFYNGSAWGAV